MALAPGSRIGLYEIVGLVGVGGMGEVYRARDTRLSRDVALKVLPQQFAADAGRLARFEREAQVLASLNHPNIATIHGFEEANGVRALVLELVDGDTLADRIGHGAIPVAEVLPIARQIADAVAAAHEQGVVHRDLKPANIKMRAGDTVKVLDFGLAKLVESTAVPADTSRSPTITSPALVTGAGVLLGTAAYMSPEQARGRAADKRSDIWSFGCVVYEMLTGRRAFAGDDVADTLAAVLRGDPDWSALPESTPEPLRRLLRRALQRTPGRRLADMADARIEIDEAQGDLEEAPRASESPTARVRFRRRDYLTVVLALLLVAVTSVVLGVMYLARPSVDRRIVHFEVPLPPGRPGPPRPELSPDGRSLAFLWPSEGTLRIWIRSLDEGAPRAIRGTDGLRNRFWWSPDSASIAFVRGGGLWKVSRDGGPAEQIASLGDVQVSYSGAWGAAGVMLLAPVQTGGGLLQIPETGGQPAAATELDHKKDERQHALPHFLPDGRHYLFLALANDANANAAYIGSLDSTERHVLPGITSEVRYSPSGHLLFVRDGALVAQRFNVDRLTLVGNPIPLVDPFSTVDALGADFTVSNDGSLAYHSNLGPIGARLVWYNRRRNELATAAPADVYVNPELSPDDRFVLFDTGSGPVGDVRMWDLERGTSDRITDHAANDGLPQWGPNGRIVFRSDRDGPGNLYTRVLGTVGPDQPLLKSNVTKTPFDWSRDGKYIAYSAGGDIWVISSDEPQKPIRVTDAPSIQTNAKISPADSRWIAYESAEYGPDEIFIQSLPTPNVKRKVSTKGGTVPRWSRDGKELFYIDAEVTLMRVSISPSGEPGVPMPLFSMPAGYQPGRSYSVASDGRFLIRVASRDQPPTPITWRLNWVRI